jgi:hypothetical protein
MDYLSKTFNIKVRDKNRRTNLGKINLDKRYTVVAIITKPKVISFTKKKGINWGIIWLDKYE